MDRPFITKICEAYYNDFELYKEHIWINKDIAVSEFSSYIIQEMDNAKFMNFPLYESVFKFSRDQQYHIIYNLLDQYLNEKYEIDNNKINPEIINEEGLVGGTLGFLGSVVGGGVDVLTSALAGLAATTTSIFGVTIGTFILLALIFFGIKHITYAKAKAAALLHHSAESLAKFVKRITNISRLENTIIFSNLEVCGHRCGIRNFKDIDKFTTFALRGIKLTSNSVKQSECLYNCFIDMIHKLVEVTTKQYVTCLKNSGDKIGLVELTSINVLLKPPSASHCKIFYDQLKTFDDDFTEAIDVLSTNQETKDKLISDYHKVLDAALKGDDSSRFNKPFQSMPHSNPNPKHQLPYKR